MQPNQPASAGRALGQALRAYFGVIAEAQKTIVENYLRGMINNDPWQVAKLAQRILVPSRRSECPIPDEVMYAALAEWDNPRTHRAMYAGLVGPRGGRPGDPLRKQPLGVNRVAGDVAALVRAADKPTAFVEQAIRYYAASRDK